MSQSNSNRADREVLDGAGLSWAIPHTFGRTVATLLREAEVPIVRISDQLGHSDPTMTARVFLGADSRATARPRDPPLIWPSYLLCYLL